MKKLLLLISFSLLYVTANAQSLRGTITTQEGAPISYATVYIEELRQGTTANIKGYYELRLPDGSYNITYQSMGYTPVYQTIDINGTTQNDISLQLQFYQIPEIRVTASGEDPAYSIIRKAIGMAPYYLNNVEQYRAEVYLKGDFVIEKMPKIVQRRVNSEIKENAKNISSVIKTDSKNVSVKEGDLFLMESFNEITFTAPDKYVQRVISARNSFPFEVEELSPMDYIQASFYQPTIADIAISPLSPQAMAHYRYQFEGATEQGNLLISKIKVIPKRKSQQLFDGYMYVVEDLWCLQSVDLTNENMGGKIHIKQLFVDVNNGMWLPVSHQFEFDIDVLGVMANASYNSSVKYITVKSNTNLQPPSTIANNHANTPIDTTLTTPKKAETLAKMEKILSKEDISNRDMAKLTRLMDKESEESQPDSVRNSLEVMSTTTKIVEPDAYKKEKGYWDDIRPIPLSNSEERSVQTREKMAQDQLIEMNSDTTTNRLPSKRKRGIVNDILFGKTWSDGQGTNLRFNGLLDINKLSFNTVDGFRYGVGLRATKKFSNGHSFSISPDISYAFSRQALLWNVNSVYNFNDERSNNISLRIGSTSKDFNESHGINPLMNSLTSLLLKKNYLKLYDDKYIALSYFLKPTNDLQVRVTARYDNRQQLENTTSFSIFNAKNSSDYTTNIPVNHYLEENSGAPLLTRYHYELSANIVYTPRLKYSYFHDEKINIGSDWPTFTLSWRHGINSETGEEGHYDAIHFRANKSHSYNLFSSLDWQVGIGGIRNSHNASLVDFSHFNNQPFPLVIDHYNDAFLLQPFYYSSTPNIYFDGYIEYTTPYLLIKYIPGISNTLCRENLNVAILATNKRPIYYEIGYSVSEIFLFAEVGIYAGFENLHYKSIGVRAAFRFNFN